jgi:hypothetical protein
MSDVIRQLIKEHHAYYEVLPYYVVIEEGHGSPAANSRRIQAGFDIDIYGRRIQNALPSQSPEYAQGYAELQKISEGTSHNAGASCSIEVIPFLSTIFFDTRNQLQPQAMMRIRVCHCGDLDEPFGPAEEHALKEIEKQLQQLGLRSGQ